MSVCASSLAIFFFLGRPADQLVGRRRSIPQILYSAPLVRTVPAGHNRPAGVPMLFEPVEVMAGDMPLSAGSQSYGSLATAVPRCAEHQRHKPHETLYTALNICTHVPLGTGTKRRQP
jgi:hypothetical protein